MCLLFKPVLLKTCDSADEAQARLVSLLAEGMERYRAYSLGEWLSRRENVRWDTKEAGCCSMWYMMFLGMSGRASHVVMSSCRHVVMSSCLRVCLEDTHGYPLSGLGGVFAVKMVACIWGWTPSTRGSMGRSVR